MSNFQEFIHSRILRHPSTWLIGVFGGIWGGINMYTIREAKRAAGEEIYFPWLWLERTIDFAFGASVQIVFLLCAVWALAGLMERANVWIRQLTLLALYLGVIWLSSYL